METVNTEELRLQMVEKLGLSALSQERQDEVMDKVTEALLKTIFIETAEQLSENEKEGMAELMDNEETTQEQMDTYLRDKIDDYDHFLEGVVAQFLDDLTKASERE